MKDRARLRIGIGIAFASVGCATPAPDARVVEGALPDTATFPYVGEVLVYRCGSLDCHGSIYRNLRVYGDEGRRYAAADRPCVPQRTTNEEYAQDYASAVGLQPEVMNQVMADKGADPERLDLLAKPMGIEAHKGLTVITRGDDSYECLTSWLSGHTDKAACVRALPPTLCRVTPGQLFADAGFE